MDAALIVIALSLAAQAGWSPDRYDTPLPAAAPTYDRYQMAPAGTANGVSPPPSISDRARNAASETATTLREGVEAGIQAANQQLSGGSEQLYDTTRRAGQEFADEFQNWAGTATQEIAPLGSTQRSAAGQASGARGKVSNPFLPAAPAPAAATTKTRGGAAPPPWTGAVPSTEPEWGNESVESVEPIHIDRTAALGAGPVRTDNGWTSVSSELAPPALLVPQLANTSQATSSQPAASRLQEISGGPSFPSAFANQQQADRTAPAQGQQATPAADANDGWALGWGTNAAQPATIGRYETSPAADGAQQTQDRTQAAAVAARPQDARQTAQQTAQNQQFDPWGDNDPWAEPSKAAAAAQQTSPSATQEPAGATVQAPNRPQSLQVAADAASQAPIGTTANQGGTMAAAPNAGTQAVAPVIGSAAPAGAPKSGEEPPWVPLLVVSLSLAGSIGANLFLGWSYMDARQKYRSLVQKTANTFRRATAAA